MTSSARPDPESAEQELARRRVALTGSRNLRDLGGYASRAGGRVRWGVLYRSGHFGELHDEARQGLSQLGIGTVMDFRTDTEREKQTSRFHDGHRPAVHELTIDPGSHEEIGQRIAERGGEADGVAAVMEDLNRVFVREHTDAYREMFSLLGGTATPAHVIHCASGKDRTGVGAALILSALGVERSVIVADYLLTNLAFNSDREVARALEDFGGPVSDFGVPADRLRPMFEVRASYLLSALDEIDSRFGGISAYLEGPMGLGADELSALRERYLDPHGTESPHGE